MFEGRTLLLASKHGKEQVIAPLFEEKFGVRCFVPSDFDSDEFGTFSGELERKDDPLTTVRKKCLQAMERYSCDLAIASEGSFGPHPSLFFVPADDELLLFMDQQNNLEIIVRELSTETNFNAQEIHSEQELWEFAELVKFPSHALILRTSQGDFSSLVKGVNDAETLLTHFNNLIQAHGSVYVETDMRAHLNPSRMQVIENAAIKLAEKVGSCCPQCQTPGFGITNRKIGLPCEHCNFPTRSTLSFVYSCSHCSYSQQEYYPHGKFTEDATYCDICNP